ILSLAPTPAMLNIQIPIEKKNLHKCGIPLDNFTLHKDDGYFKMQLLMHLMDTTSQKRKKNLGNIYTKKDIMKKAAGELSNFKIDMRALKNSIEKYEDNSDYLCRPVLRVIKSN
uniref:hypothetical protein n=1 Tax=Spirosoma sp. TaxID=1899569 RepID=UPI003B3AB998